MKLELCPLSVGLLISTLLTTVPLQSADLAEELRNAAKKGNVPRVTALLNQAVDVNAIDNAGHNAIFWAAEKGHLEVIRLLLSRGADPDQTAKYRYGCKLQVRKGITGGDTVYATCTLENSYRVTGNALFTAIFANQFEAAHMLISSGKVNLLAKDSDGNTALGQLSSQLYKRSKMQQVRKLYDALKTAMKE